MTAEHLPLRSSWDCDTCGRPWPCDPARERLAVEHVSRPTVLAMLMWQYLEDYSRDAGPGPLGEAYERFLSWTRQGDTGGR
jgi:hypothetical protein